MNIDISVIIQDIISGLIITAVTAGASYLFINRYMEKISFSNKMRSYGFWETSTNKQTRKEIKKMCEEAVKIKIINVSGIRYLNNNEYMLKMALKRGIEIDYLLANPKSIFLYDIETMEKNTIIDGKPIRDKNTFISDEILNLINKYKDSGLNIKLYSTEYRLPYILAYYEDGSVDAWLTVTLPPYKSNKSFVLRGKRSANEYLKNEEDINFIDMMESNFDSIWEHGSISLETLENESLMNNYQIWMERYNIAKKNIMSAKEKSDILIEVAAQHPLIDGKYPNDEFKKRLDLSMELYYKYKKNGKIVKIYVPGSIHQKDGIADLISLSESGFNYLVEHKIPKTDIYADEANKMYKGSEGVYNSSDECFVATQLFFCNNFGELHCVCSSAQIMRKALSYIQFGVLPYMHSITCEEMYHNYIDEIFEKIPVLLQDGNGLQGDSLIADKIRKSRNPNIN